MPNTSWVLWHSDMDLKPGGGPGEPKDCRIQESSLLHACFCSLEPRGGALSATVVSIHLKDCRNIVADKRNAL